MNIQNVSEYPLFRKIHAVEEVYGVSSTSGQTTGLKSSISKTISVQTGKKCDCLKEIK